MDDFDREKAQEMVMALLALHCFQDLGAVRAWKSYDWKLLDALHERGWISSPKSKAKSVLLTDEGLARGKELLARWLDVQDLADD